MFNCPLDHTHLLWRGLLGDLGIYELPEIVGQASVSQMSVFGQNISCEVIVLEGKKLVSIRAVLLT
jgi:hypothetical protein